ncbi:hypothetical protein CRG98_009999 [Punica granatum]|uniref:G-patch domain-containing protein n=1 Tax=Punica granatum TaxID=22663 RepID=A0A2I0KM79_PUNGR|nr:hypothetical protein CRG98_009999 [Punica granatum]
MSAMGITHSRRVYQGPESGDKGKAPVAAFSAISEAAPLHVKKVTDQEVKAFTKVIKASEYKVVEQMGKSQACISLLALLLSSESHRDALLKVLTAAQVPKETTPNRIEETVNSIFSNQISFAEDELPSEDQGHLRALHIVCKCSNHIVGRVMIDNGSTLNDCPVSTLKQMNVDMGRIRASKTTVRAFDGSKREVNGEIDLLINVGPCLFSITFQILEIPNAFSLLLGRPWIHVAGAISSSLHQKLKFFVEGKLITVNSEEDYAVYKETTVPYISVGEDQNLPFHSFETISVIRDYGEVGPSRADRMIGKVLLKNDYVPRTGLGARAQGILQPIEVMGGTSDIPSTKLDDFSSDAVEAFLALPAIYAVIEEISSGVHIRPAGEDEELTIWTAVPLYSTMVADVLSLVIDFQSGKKYKLKSEADNFVPITQTEQNRLSSPLVTRASTYKKHVNIRLFETVFARTLIVRRSSEPQNSNARSIEPRASSGFLPGQIGSTQVISHKTTTTATSGGLLGVESHRPCIKRPPGASYRAFSSSGASRENLRVQSSRNQRRRDPHSVKNPTQLAPREKNTPINRYSPDKPDCQSGLPADRTASRVFQPTRLHQFGSFQAAEPTSRAPFSDFPRLFLHPEARECSCASTQVRARFEAARVGVYEPSLNYFWAERSFSRLSRGQHDPDGPKGSIGTSY